MEKLTGLPVATVFWAATDDTDFREASKVAVAVTGARELVMQPTAPVGLPMAKMPLGDVSALLEELFAASGSGVNTAAVGQLKQFYSSGNTVGGAYVSLLRELFTPLGIAVLDASHEAVRQASLLFVKLALDRETTYRVVSPQTTPKIEKEGHSLQVQDVAGLSLVFENSAEGRKRIPRKRGARDIRPDAELGPNVLLRPIVERQILPTVAYVGVPPRSPTSLSSARSPMRWSYRVRSSFHAGRAPSSSRTSEKSSTGSARASRIFRIRTLSRPRLRRSSCPSARAQGDRRV